MRVHTLRTYQYRNLQDGIFEFDPGVNIFLGANAQGKTNLVEAIHFLSQTKSFRTSQTKELVKWGADATSVYGVLRFDSLDAEIEIGISLKQGQKELYVNRDKTRAVADYLGRLITVSFSPTDISLVKGSPSGRRRFVDKHLVDLLPRTITSLMNYQRALKHKLALLKEATSDISAVEPWNRILATEAATITQARTDFIRMLESSAQQLLNRFAPNDPLLSLSLESNSYSESPTFDDIFARLMQSFERERHARSALVGPHRDDLLIKLGSQDTRAFASQGQARSIVLSLILGVLELIERTRGEPPVILLDDVNSELDLERSQAFFDLVLERKRQIFVTGTDASVGHLQQLGSFSTFEVVNGAVARV